jgi:hypothetical protein
MKSLQTISQIIPIVLIICYLLFPTHFIDTSKTYLGKIIVIFIICVYTLQDTLHGLLICLLVILYYHQDVETFVSKSTQYYVEYIPKPSRKMDTLGLFENNLEKDFTSVSTAYPDHLKPIKKASEALFRKEKCHGSKVTYKNQTMKNQMITHVYPELQFNDGVCNPCDPTCHFGINKKQKEESKLKPINSHTSVLDDIKELFGMKNSEPVILNKNMVISEYS